MVPAAWLVGACKWPLLCLVAAATLLQTSMDAVSLHQVCGELGCGGTHSTFWDHPFSAFTHWGAGTDSYSARQNQILCHLGVYRNRIALSGMGLWGFPLTAFQNIVLLLRDFLLWSENLHAPDKRLDVSAMGAA